jgi:hypothetical protein
LSVQDLCSERSELLVLVHLGLMRLRNMLSNILRG